MKISAKQYALGLYEMIAEATKPETEKIIANFVKLLAHNRHLDKAKEIISEIEKIWESEHGELVAEIVSAHELGKEAKTLVTDYLKKKTKKETIILTEKVDKKILGGFVLKYEGKIIDGSLKNNLDTLKVKLEA